MTRKLNISIKKRIGEVATRALAMLLALCALVFPTAAFAVGTQGSGTESAENVATDGALGTRVAASRRISYTLPGVGSKNLWSHTTYNIQVNGKLLSLPAARINDILYLPMEAFLTSVGTATVSYNSQSRTATARMSGLDISVNDGAFVLYANDRPLFSFSPTVVMTNGVMYVPATALEKATGIKRTSTSQWTVNYSGSYSPLAPASKFYRSDEVLWLSKIISAESRGEPLIGQIAVGNVILNRVRSPLYPNTIWGVIFDRKYGVQFSPVANGTIYNEPAYISTLAAKICLEGTALSDNALFFHDPVHSESSWIQNNRTYLYTILNHDFYA